MVDRGRIVLVGTPIGNLGDLAPRALEVLTSADVVACEDTRRTGRLLELCGERARSLVRLDDHTERGLAAELVGRAASGQVIAVVTDAGMPGIADPGEALVAAAVAADVDVEVVPGPSAAVAALVVSGLTTGRWVFEGFLPRKGAERGRRLASVAAEERTVVLFEAPHRLVRTLEDLAGVLEATRRLAIGRELTKLHEEVWRGPVDEAVTWARDGSVRGEYVIVVEGAAPPPEPSDDMILDALAGERARGASTRDAAAAVAEQLGVGRRRVYDLAVGGSDTA